MAQRLPFGSSLAPRAPIVLCTTSHTVIHTKPCLHALASTSALLSVLLLLASFTPTTHAIMLHSIPCDAMSTPPLLETGNMPLDGTSNASLFYWLFRTPNPTPDQPLGIWFHGGPGCSAALGLFYEHGPYRFVNNSLCYGYRHAWVNAGISMVYVDSPLGTGFSYAPNPADLATNETMLATHILHFLQAFYTRYPEFQQRPLFLMGVSYAGHMIPNIAAAVVDANRQGRFSPPIKLQGITLGNPWVSPGHQYGAYGEFARSRGLIDEQQADTMATQGVALCNVSLAACHDHGTRVTCLNAWRVCQNATFDVIVRSNPGINVYDVTKRCIGPACYDYSAMERMFKQPETLQLLKAQRAWTGICDSKAHEALMPDWAQDYQPLLGQLLDAGVRVLVYAGLDDLTCPWLGLQRALRAMQWQGQAAFTQASPGQVLVNGAVVGQEWSAAGLMFVTVEGAGHEVPMVRVPCWGVLYCAVPVRSWEYRIYTQEQPAVAQMLIARFVSKATATAAAA